MSSTTPPSQSNRWARRIVLGLAATVLTVGVVLIGIVVLLSKPLPKGDGGTGGEALARNVERQINKEAWERTGAVRWTFAGRNRHLWDRSRGLSRVQFGQHDVMLSLHTKQGIALTAGQRQTSGEAQKLIEKAYAHWINDSFWLNPLVKLFDDGVSRQVVPQTDGTQSLLISYNSGGLTPGDSYLWLLDGSNRPRAFRMWVSIIPLKGIEASWDGWQTLPTGAQVSTEHKIGPVTLRLTEVAGAATLADLEPGGDPFAALF